MPLHFIAKGDKMSLETSFVCDSWRGCVLMEGLLSAVPSEHGGSFGRHAESREEQKLDDRVKDPHPSSHIRSPLESPAGKLQPSLG